MSEQQAKVALVTGGARRIGAELVRTLHGAGYRVAIHYRSSTVDAQALADELNAKRADSAVLLQADLMDPDAPSRLVEQTLALTGRLDLLINNASAFYPTPLGQITHAQVDELFASNARAPLFLAQAAADSLRANRGAILNLVDIYADRPLPDYLPYCMAKAALVAMTYGLARALGPEVRVNAIAPGNIVWSENKHKADTPEVILERTALQRQGSPEALASAALFLLDQGEYITGQVLRVDGGRWLFI